MITYPFSENPQENKFPKEYSIIVKRDYTDVKTNINVQSVIEVDQKKLNELFPVLNADQIKDLTIKILETVVQVNLIEKQL